ncbi:leucine--tRNA ligase [Methylacidiphilum caldifontis]|uniref:leucine--tRNA ligase n=1 Tax=Methylacidiphilum caldifontis TaxID=2795386 RepID=UPI001A8CE709|nr:leucine--tRNA ligase [Methylacidiphilum caldifontis]QSR88320.1 leucine--tRNA ligase [Methylacidiphilum caldifontis]
MSARKAYPFDDIEPKWQHYWLDKRLFRAADPGEEGSNKPKFYVLDMFPYPSGSGLHVGHLEGYTASDIIARYKRMKGFNVLHPMGWDAFGLPAEQHAILTGTHPAITTKQNIANFKRQIQSMGFSYDWSREIDTTDPAYYKWTQWIFLKLFEKGLAYVAEAPVWYCPMLKTVLANEEIIHTPEGPRSERGNHPVIRKLFRQWFLKITAYAEKLLEGLETVQWPESIKEMQRHWIGRSEGALIKFAVEGKELEIEIFTTRPDTLFGATFLVLAPEHPLVEAITAVEYRNEVENYRAAAFLKSDLERTELSKNKTGVWTGGYAIHPVTGDKLPIWISDYVLMTYGTGAIMAVPAHDYRDYEFAKTFGLPIKKVVVPEKQTEEIGSECFTGEGVAVHSGFISGLRTAEAKKKIIEWLEEKKRGKKDIQYKLRDWLFSRQRYWGEPFPIIWKEGKPLPVPEEDLPVLLPDLDDFTPTDEGIAPLSRKKDWVVLPDGGKREINTMPQWAGSCWYYLRYCDPSNEKLPFAAQKEKYWLSPHGVDLYIGGAEHAVLHLLYARFWHKVLYDIGLVSSPEPFYKLVNQGIILGEDNQKMAKSRGNVVNPDAIIQEFGADTLRLFEMFLGPLQQSKPWSSKGLEGPYRFLARVWRLFMDEDGEGLWVLKKDIVDEEPPLPIKKLLHQTVAEVTQDIENFQFHTAIAKLMTFVNELTKEKKRWKSVLEKLLLLLSPFAPHICEELWHNIGHKDSLAYEPWPEYDPKFLEEEWVEIIVQIDGKVRGRLRAKKDADKDELTTKATDIPAIAKWLENRVCSKIVYVPNRLINFVLE